MSIDNADDLEGMRRAGAAARAALDAMAAALRPGVQPAELDALCGRVLAAHGAESAPRRVYGLDADAFVSVGSDVVHGLPSERPLEPGDVVKLDVTPWLDGYVADAARTFVVPPAAPAALELVACAEAALASGLRALRAGRPLRHVGRAVEREVRRRGFRVLRELSGHSLGRTIHEPPYVANFEDRLERTVVTPGLVLAVEPMISAGSGRVVTRADGVTIGTPDGSLTAHVEHTVVAGRGAPLVLAA